MKILAFDCGQRRTGVAFVDTEQGVPVPLETIEHTSKKDAVFAMAALAKERGVEKIVLGLPLLLSGEEGAQTALVREVGSLLSEQGFDVQYIDERFTSFEGKNDQDGDARAAFEILTIMTSRIHLTNPKNTLN